MNRFDFDVKTVKKFNWLGWLKYEAAVRRWKDEGGEFPFAAKYCFFDIENNLRQTGYVAIHRTKPDIRIYFEKKTDFSRKLKQLFLIDYEETNDEERPGAGDGEGEQEDADTPEIEDIRDTGGSQGSLEFS